MICSRAAEELLEPWDRWTPSWTGFLWCGADSVHRTGPHRTVCQGFSFILCSSDKATLLVWWKLENRVYLLFVSSSVYFSAVYSNQKQRVLYTFFHCVIDLQHMLEESPLLIC